MKLNKTQVKLWGFLTIVNFFIFDIIWILDGGENISWTSQHDLIELLFDLFYCAFFSLSCFLICLLTIRFMGKKGIITRERVAYPSLITLLLNIGFALILCFIYGLIVPQDIALCLWDGIYVFTIIATINSLFLVNSEYSEMLVQQYKKNVEYKEHFLRAQLNPHFLFNSFSTLSELIHVDAKIAERFTLELSDIYRYVLNNLDRDYVNIQEGIEFAKRYIEVINIRFENYIDLSVNYSEDQQKTYIIPWSIQLVLENAIKYNLASESQGLKINICVEDDYVVVYNNLIPDKDERTQKSDSTGIGLKNLAERYRIRFGKRLMVKKTEKEFIVKIPVIRK